MTGAQVNSCDVLKDQALSPSLTEKMEVKDSEEKN